MAEVSKKSGWPRTSEGTIDWEIVFEDSEIGLIIALRQAKSQRAVIDIAALIIQMLFTRDGDDDLRQSYTMKLASVATKHSGDDAFPVMDEMEGLLREIKRDRIAKASEFVTHKAQRDQIKATAPEKKKKREFPERIPLEGPEGIFEDIFCDAMDQRFQVMWAGVPQETEDEKLPYLISAEFARVYEDAIRQFFMPDIIPRSRHIIAEIERQKSDRRTSFFRKKINEKQVHSDLWRIWSHVWDHLTLERDVPTQRPENQSRIGGLMKKIKAAAMEEGDLDDAEWDEDIQMIETQNEVAREVWTRLTAAGDTYDAPPEDDRELLKTIFARTAGGIRSQIAALRQIAQQSESVGRAYNQYEGAKDLQLALIAAAYQYPDLFFGEEKIMRGMLRGYKEHELKKRYPLVMRYLGDRLDL